MMILRSSPLSPFSRKVKIAASLLGLSAEIAIEPADTNDPSDSLLGQNPLGKIPVLILADGVTLFDSRVIVEYLDHVAGGGKLIPLEPRARFDVLARAALADGLMEATLLKVYETRYHDQGATSERWLDKQESKVQRTLSAFAAAPPPLDDITVAEIGLACALGYLDLRQEGRWRRTHRALVAWLDAFSGRVPSFPGTHVDA